MASYKYGSFGQNLPVGMTPNQAIWSYGTTDLDSIASQAAQTQQLNDGNAAAIAMRQKQAALEAELKAKRDDERQRNILGLSSLQAQALDENSPLYETTMENGRTPRANGFGVEMSIGDENGGAPAPINDSFIGLGPLRRTLKPEYEQVREQALTPQSRTRSVEEALAIEKGKADLRERILTIQNDQRLSLEQKKAAVEALMRGSSYEANDPTNVGKGGAIGDKLVLDVQGVYNQPQAQPQTAQAAPPINEPAPIQAPAFSDEQAKVLKTTPAGKYIQLPDGRVQFEYADGRRIDYKGNQ